MGHALQGWQREGCYWFQKEREERRGGEREKERRGEERRGEEREGVFMRAMPRG